MAVYYINGTSNSGTTFGTSGYFYPLYLTAAEANSASDNTAGTSHAHTFEEVVNTTFYMPTTGAIHASATSPSGNYSGEVYVSYTSPIAEEDVEEIGFGVLAGDTFNSWRKKTNDVARETITNKAAITSVDTRLTRLLSVTGGENNIMTLTSSDNITGEKEFEGIVKFSAADDSTNAIQVGDNGKIYVESSSFKFTKSIDLHTAGAEIKASDFDVPTGRTKYAGVQYTWPSQAPIPGQILKSGTGNTLNWATETVAEANVEAFLIEDPNPIGSIYQWTLTNPPSKWLVCDGSDVYRVDTVVNGVIQPGYPDLFGVIRKTYNLSTDTGADFTGETPVKFRLPNLQGRVPIGVGTNTDAIGTQAQFTLGQTNAVVDGVTLSGGEYQHTLIEGESPSHRHFAATTGSDGTAYLQVNSGNQNLAIEAEMSYHEPGVGSGEALYQQPNFEYILYGSTSTPNVGITSSSGNDEAHNIVQPFIALTYIIKAEGSTIVTQNLKPENGLLLSSDGGATYSSNTSNILQSGADNRIKLDVDSNDFEFSGNQLKLVDTNYRSGEVIEKFYELVPYGSDSKTITLHGGTNYALNTISQTDVDNKGIALTTSYIDIEASEIDYVCPVGAKTIIYRFHFHAGRGDNSPLIHVRLRLGPSTAGGSTALADTEVDMGYRSHYHQGSDEFHYEFPFEIVQTAEEEDREKGKIFKDNWEGISRNIKLEARDYSTSNDAFLYRLDHQDGVEVDRFTTPKIGIETTAR
jgi:microcystin-dependent protein